MSLGCAVSSLALTAMNKYPEAISYFKKALVLDPENDTYKSNLKIAEQKQKEATSPVSCVVCFWCSAVDGSAVHLPVNAMFCLCMTVRHR